VADEDKCCEHCEDLQGRVKELEDRLAAVAAQARELDHRTVGSIMIGGGSV
jgi:hypothetical protein